MINREDLPLDKKQLINKFQNMVMEIEYEFLQNKLFQPIGIELATVPVVIEVEETNIFKDLGSKNAIIPPAYYRPDTDSIHIFVEHNSFIKRTDKNEQYMFLLFLLFHEASHRLFMTMKRKAERDHELWNIATDLEIHNMYYVYSEIIKLNKNSFSYNNFEKYCNYIDKFLIKKENQDPELNEGLFESEYLDYIAEEIYQLLLNSKKEFTETVYFDNDGNILNSSNNDDGDGETNNSNNSNGKSGGVPDDIKNASGMIKVTISEYTLPSGQKITTSNIETFGENTNDKKSSEAIQNEENAKNLRKTILQNTLREEAKKAESRGTISGKCKSFLKKLLHVKVDWVRILRNSLLSALDKSDYFSWSRPRTSLYGMPDAPYLPSQCEDFEKYGTLIIARDESGSMSDLEVSKAAGIISDAKAHYKKIIVLKHDTEITDIIELEELDDESIKKLVERTSCGGTSHKEVFEWIRDYYIKNRETENKISCVISISDLYSDIEEYQNIIPTEIPKIYLTPVGNEKKFPGIKGTIIPVEL